jgi:hypothetical protein
VCPNIIAEEIRELTPLRHKLRLLDTLTMVFICHSLYWYTVTNFGLYSGMRTIVSSDFEAKADVQTVLPVPIWRVQLSCCSIATADRERRSLVVQIPLGVSEVTTMPISSLNSHMIFDRASWQLASKGASFLPPNDLS